MKKPVYLDVDTGIDDALAILLAVLHPVLDVRGITTVDGNVDLEQVTRNTLQVLDVAGADAVPVVSGADHALAGPTESAAAVHGEDGLGGANLPPPSREPAGDDVVAFLRDELMRAEEPVTIIALAPLTNIANLLTHAPEVKPKIERLAIMGGSAGPGNATPVAEFNIYHDPEAADVVFSSGVPILMYGLDVFYQVRFTRDEVEQWFGANTSGADETTSIRDARGLVAHLLHFAMNNFGVEDASIGDAGCVACVIDESGLTTQRLPVFVETEGRYCRGQTVVDRRPNAIQRLNRSGATISFADVGLDINAEFYRTLFRKTIRSDDEN